MENLPGKPVKIQMKLVYTDTCYLCMEVLPDAV